MQKRPIATLIRRSHGGTSNAGVRLTDRRPRGEVPIRVRYIDFAERVVHTVMIVEFLACVLVEFHDRNPGFPWALDVWAGEHGGLVRFHRPHDRARAALASVV